MSKGSGSSALVAVEKRICLEIERSLALRTDLEPKLAGAARALSVTSLAIRTQLLGALRELVKKDAFERELYGAGVRALAEAADKRLTAPLSSALKTDDFGGLPALSAACFVSDAALGPLLARAAACPKTQLAFAAEVARACRGEPTGARLFALAPRIKEAHRIALCVDLLLPLSLRLDRVAEKACASLADALHVLRGSERHLGRWLVMAEIAHHGGDDRGLKEAVERTSTGPDSSRAAWALVAWALDEKRGTGGTRPTSELVARLSHRPSADRDTAFLFRMAERKVDVARPMLEALARTKPLGDDVALRASFMLVKYFDKLQFKDDIIDAADASERDDLRALAAAALFELGDREHAVRVAEPLAESPDIAAQAWCGLVCASSNGAGKPAAAQSPLGPAHPTLLSEPTFRRVQWGWIE